MQHMEAFHTIHHKSTDISANQLLNGWLAEFPIILDRFLPVTQVIT